MLEDQLWDNFKSRKPLIHDTNELHFSTNASLKIWFSQDEIVRAKFNLSTHTYAAHILMNPPRENHFPTGIF